MFIYVTDGLIINDEHEALLRPYQLCVHVSFSKFSQKNMEHTSIICHALTQIPSSSFSSPMSIFLFFSASWL